jgi:MFS family permease
LLYVGYNVAAALISVPAGWHGDRYHPVQVLAAGAVIFAAGYAWFAAGSHQPLVLLAAFVLTGLAMAAGKLPRAPPLRASRRASCAARPSGCSLGSSPSAT